MLKIFEEGIIKVYRSYYIYFNKAVVKKQRTKPIQNFSKIPISDYDVHVCLLLRQYSVMFLFFHVMFLKSLQKSVSAFYALMQRYNIWLLNDNVNH